jgi:zinc protease
VGSIWLYSNPVPGVSLDSLQAAFAREINLMIDEPLKQEELERAKTRLIDSAIYARDSVSGPAMIIGQSLAAGATLDDVETWPEQISKVSGADVQAVLKKYLSPTDPAFKPVTGFLLPKESKP